MLRLSPAATPVWRSPDALQLGVDPALVVLRDLGDPQLRMLAALSAGCDRERLVRVARAFRVPVSTVDAFLDVVAPALAEPPARLTLQVDGPQDLVAALDERAADGGAGPVVLAAHHVLPPHRSRTWLQRDVPHIPVVFTDVAVTVGPWIVPGVTGCTRCADEHRIDVDPAWPAIAGQLLRRTTSAAAADRLLVAHARRTTRDAVLAGGLDGVVRIEPDRFSRLPAPEAHPRCSCRGLA